MGYALLKGHESEQRLLLLLSLTNIRSESMIKALKFCYVNGMDEKTAVMAASVTQSNFNRCVGVLTEVNMKIEKIKEYDSVQRKVESKRGRDYKVKRKSVK